MARQGAERVHPDAPLTRRPFVLERSPFRADRFYRSESSEPHRSGTGRARRRRVRRYRRLLGSVPGCPGDSGRAGDRDRTGMASLEGWGSAIELHPRNVALRLTTLLRCFSRSCRKLDGGRREVDQHVGAQRGKRGGRPARHHLDDTQADELLPPFGEMRGQRSGRAGHTEVGPSDAALGEKGRNDLPGRCVCGWRDRRPSRRLRC